MIISATIGVLFLLGVNAEQKKILIRKRAAELNKRASTHHSSGAIDYDIATELLGQKTSRQVQVKN